MGRVEGGGRGGCVGMERERGGRRVVARKRGRERLCMVEGWGLGRGMCCVKDRVEMEMYGRIEV